MRCSCSESEGAVGAASEACAEMEPSELDCATVGDDSLRLTMRDTARRLSLGRVWQSKCVSERDNGTRDGAS